MKKVQSKSPAASTDFFVKSEKSLKPLPVKTKQTLQQKKSDNEQSGQLTPVTKSKRRKTPPKRKSAFTSAARRSESIDSYDHRSSRGGSRHKIRDSDDDDDDDVENGNIRSDDDKEDSYDDEDDTVVTGSSSSSAATIRGDPDRDLSTPPIPPMRKKTSADLLAEESLTQGLTEGRFWNEFGYQHPKQRSKVDWDLWSELTFYPSSSSGKKVEAKGDIEEGSLRVAEDEGIFIGEPLKLQKRHLNRLEHRLLKENATDWFRSDGKLKGSTDPYREEPLRVFQNNLAGKENSFEQLTTFVPAKLDPFQELQFMQGDFLRGRGQGSAEVTLELGTIHFQHHPLFSKEHVLSSRLEEAYAEYTARNLVRVTDRATNKIKALREAVQHTKQSVMSMDISDPERPKVKERIRNYRVEMQRASLERDQGYWDDRMALVNVLELWRELKHLRREQGYANTNVRLSIMEIPIDPKEDKVTWQRAVEEEFNDLKEEYDEMYDEEDATGSGTGGNARRKSFSVTKDGHLAIAKPDDSDTTAGTETATDDVSDVSKSTKKMPKFDAEMTLKLIEKRHSELRRQPGEPILKIDLLKTHPVTPTNQLPEGSTKEDQRRKIAEKVRVQVKIFFNEKEIYTSKGKCVQSQDFSGFLGLSIPITIKEWPEILEIQILDTAAKLRSEFVRLQFPDSKASIDRCHTQKLAFTSYDELKTSSGNGVGSGITFDIMGKEYPPQYPRGFITTRLGWSVDTNGAILCPTGIEKLERTKSEHDHDARKQAQRSLDSAASDFDPNDPMNCLWKSLKVKKSSIITPKPEIVTLPQGEPPAHEEELEFELDGELKEFEFCSMDIIERSPRLRLLHLRDQEVPEFKALKMIPAFDHDIPLDIFKRYERRVRDDARKRAGGGGGGVGSASYMMKSSRKKIPFDSLDESLYESNRLEKIREMRLSVLELFENCTKQITFEDFVVEEQIPDIGTLGLNLMQLFQPRRPLRPTRKERKRVQGSNLIDTKINLIVNLVRAFNLPMRRDQGDLQGQGQGLTTEAVTGVQLLQHHQSKTGHGGHGHGHGQSGGYATVRPFVEVWFQRNVCRTTTALGSNPTWNQELQLNLWVPNDDYSQTNLSRMDDLVYFHVYDEVTIDLLEDDRRRDTDIHQRLEKRWLGTISIPFSTLYANGRIEGTFKLNSPSILLGYEPQGMASHFGSVVAKMQQTSGVKGQNQGLINSGSNSSKNSFITIFLTLQPSVTPQFDATTLKEDTQQSGETSEMVQHVKSWKNAHEMKFPERSVKPFVMTSEGDTVLCTRFLRSLEPPSAILRQTRRRGQEEGQGQDTMELLETMENLAHYVSLFPCVRDSTLGIIDYSLWFNSDIFISAPGGGIEDHSVLLACYFMYLNVSTWIIQGNAIPDGPTTFVVSSFKGQGSKNEVVIWNPVTGDCYSANDNFCPLQKVWAAIGSTNIWVNVGEGERPHQIDWDIARSKSWAPLFSKPVPEAKIPCLQGVQPIRYKTADQVQANSLAQRIERHLKEVFMKWRATSKTNWNRYCSATLRRLLPKLEESKLGRTSSYRDLGVSGTSSAFLEHSSGGTSGGGGSLPSMISLSEEHLIELRDIMTSYQMTGFPLQQPYTNMECLIETVFATGVHTIDAPDVEFAVAAYAHAYPASVYSVWIYVAALHRRK